VVYTLSPRNARKKRTKYHSDNDVPLSACTPGEVGSGEGGKEVTPGHGLALLGEVDDRVGKGGNNVL
jgi:hypothetical protein